MVAISVNVEATLSYGEAWGEPFYLRGARVAVEIGTAIRVVARPAAAGTYRAQPVLLHKIVSNASPRTARCWDQMVDKVARILYT